ncbi:MAG TPA: hypothetical protein VLV81_14180 [Acidimicrobiia bacterium]|nr:hypothetical protein [Acidimicrobiia bacterium]
MPKILTIGTAIVSWPTRVWVFQSSSWRWPVRVQVNKIRAKAQSSLRGMPSAPKCQMIASGNATLSSATTVPSTIPAPRGLDAQARSDTRVAGDSVSAASAGGRSCSFLDTSALPFSGATARA